MSFRYAGWQGAFGQSILKGGKTMEDMAAYVDEKAIEPQPKSGRQEWLEAVVNQFV